MRGSATDVFGVTFAGVGGVEIFHSTRLALGVMESEVEDVELFDGLDDETVEGFVGGVRGVEVEFVLD
jgi:hypothetical protein